MGYIATHKRKVMGTRMHGTLEERQIEMEFKEKESNQNNSYLSQISKISEIEKVESKYLVPEVKNWVETD